VIARERSRIVIRDPAGLIRLARGGGDPADGVT